MLITTPQELKQFFPTHVMESIESMAGALDNSEHDFLLEKIGSPLYGYVTEAYKTMYREDNTSQLVPLVGNENTPKEMLISLCQRVVAFDAFSRSVHLRAVSMNDSGFNDVSAAGYDATSRDSLNDFKAQCVKESHAAVNRLLVQLENWAKEVAPQPQPPVPPVPTPEPENPETPETEIPEAGKPETEAPEGSEMPQPMALAAETAESEDMAQKREIVELWKSSAYYYLQEDLLISTASCLNRFLDIYDNRERFVQMVPDIRYIHEMIVAPEIGDELLTDLAKKCTDGNGNAMEKKTITMLQRAVALHLEARNKMFKRPMAASEAIQAMKLAVDYIRKHVDSYDQKAIKTSPFYEETSPVKGWDNSKKDSYGFVTRPIF